MTSVGSAIGNLILDYVKMCFRYIITIMLGTSIVYWMKHLEKRDFPHEENKLPYAKAFLGGNQENIPYFSKDRYGWPYTWKNQSEPNRSKDSTLDYWVIKPWTMFIGQWFTTIWKDGRLILFTLLQGLQDLDGRKFKTKPEEKLNKESIPFELFMLFIGIITAAIIIYGIIPFGITILTTLYGLFNKQKSFTRLGYGFFYLVTLFAPLSMVAINGPLFYLKMCWETLITPWQKSYEDWDSKRKLKKEQQKGGGLAERMAAKAAAKVEAQKKALEAKAKAGISNVTNIAKDGLNKVSELKDKAMEMTGLKKKKNKVPNTLDIMNFYLKNAKLFFAFLFLMTFSFAMYDNIDPLAPNLNITNIFTGVWMIVLFSVYMKWNFFPEWVVGWMKEKKTKVTPETGPPEAAPPAAAPPAAAKAPKNTNVEKKM